MTTLTEVKERPILFQTEMVKGVLADVKDLTRRTKGLEKVNERPNAWRFDGINRNGDFLFYNVHAFVSGHDPQDCVLFVKCPYGKPGDVLWVRETWAPFLRGDGGDGYVELVKFKADGFEMPWTHDKDYAELGWHWRPSIHMPRAACRLRLEIVSIGVERLQDITEEDAIKEGILFYNDEIIGGRRFKDYASDSRGYGHPEVDYATVSTAKESFQTLWTKINGPESWNANPWCWRIEFKRIQ